MKSVLDLLYATIDFYYDYRKNLTQNITKISQIITNLVIANAKMAQNFRSTKEKIISKNNVFKKLTKIFRNI